MRILFLATRDGLHPEAAGGDIQMWEYARYLASRGHTVTFVAAHFLGAARQEIAEGIGIVRLGGVGSLWLRTFLHYMRHCRGKYDVVVAEGFGGSRIPRWAPLYVREPMVTEWHQVHRALFASQYPRVLLPALNLLERVTAHLHRDTLVRAGTKDWQEAFPTIGFKKSNIFVVPVSVKEEWLNDARAGQVSEPRIVWLGKFRRYKCPHHVLLAMREVLREVPQTRLVLAGRQDDRRYERTLWRLVRTLGIEENVEFQRNITERQKRELLKSSRGLILPSSVEGFGIVVLEANACGVPVIASTGVPWGAVQHGSNGLRYPFGDIDALARSIVELLKNDALYARLSASGLAFARQFGWRAVGAKFEEVVEHAVRNPSARAVEHVAHRAPGRTGANVGETR